MCSKLFKINFAKLKPNEFKTFTDILNRYFDLCKPVKDNGRGRTKNDYKTKACPGEFCRPFSIT